MLSQEGENPLIPEGKEQMSGLEEYTTARACWRGGEQRRGLSQEAELGSFVPRDCSAQGVFYSGRIEQVLLETEKHQALPGQSSMALEIYLLI